MDTQAKSVDPILTLQVPSSVASLSFIQQSNSTIISSSTQDSSSDEEIDLRCSSLQQEQPAYGRTATPWQCLSSRYLATSHINGDAFLWDLGRQQIKNKIITDREGPGLAIKRIWSLDQFMLQTRDPLGIVSLHSCDRDGTPAFVRYETCSQTFCQASPCIGDPNLLALPSRNDSTATVVDVRDQNPVCVIPATSHGMLTSLAMSITHGTGRPILACGMESGSIFFHDFSAGRLVKADYKLSKDPILAMDLAPSFGFNGASLPAAVVIAGMAGDAAEELELPNTDRGRVALLKVTLNEYLSWDVRLRARVSTCRVDEKSAGKPGVSICKFRPGDGRLWAVGGWDYRVRLFDRSRGNPLAILRGHKSSIGALDWAPDADSSGLLASSGTADRQIFVWQCFSRR